MAEPETLRVHIPLPLCNRGGRPRILPPKEIEVAMECGQDARLLRAIGRAWDWRCKLERGDVTTIADLAREEGISDRYVSRVIRLAWLSPSVLERLVLRREPTVLSILDLCGMIKDHWAFLARRIVETKRILGLQDRVATQPETPEENRSRSGWIGLCRKRLRQVFVWQVFNRRHRDRDVTPGAYGRVPPLQAHMIPLRPVLVHERPAFW